MRKQMQFSVERPRLERELDRLEAGGLGVIAGARRAARRAIALFEEMEIAPPRNLVQLSAGGELDREFRARTNEPH